MILLEVGWPELLNSSRVLVSSGPYLSEGHDLVPMLAELARMGVTTDFMAQPVTSQTAASSEIRRHSWSVARALLGENYSYLIVEGVPVARALAGNQDLRKRYWLFLTQRDFALLDEGYFSVAFLRAALDGARLVVCIDDPTAERARSIIDAACIFVLGTRSDDRPHSSVGRLSELFTLSDWAQISSAAAVTIEEGGSTRESLEKDGADGTVDHPHVVVSLEFPASDTHGPERRLSSMVIPFVTAGGSNSGQKQHATKWIAWHLRRLYEDVGANYLIVRSPELARYSTRHASMSTYSWVLLDEDTLDEAHAGLGLGSPTAIAAGPADRLIVNREVVRSLAEIRFPHLAGRIRYLPCLGGGDALSDASEKHSPSLLLRRYGAHKNEAPLKNVLVAGHDMKFMGQILGIFSRHESVNLKLDNWSSQLRHDSSLSEGHARWAHLIWCEFATRNAVWYSRRKRADQTLIVRVHGYELSGGWLDGLNVEAVDTWICVSELLKRELLDELPIPPERVLVVPNVIDVEDFRREKIPEARFHLGMVGITPDIKRPDRALDLLEELNQYDGRYVLHIRGEAPFNYGWVWQDRDKRDSYLALYERVAQNPMLRRSVSFDAPGRDMARWLKKIGWILSPSTRESFHLAAVEGMASGAVPIVWDREGAGDIFPPELIHSSTEDAARWLRSRNSSADRFSGLSSTVSPAAWKYDLAQMEHAILSIVFD